MELDEDSGQGVPYVVTGAAGFIGFHISKALLESGHRVFGIDRLDSYYDVNLKLSRLANLRAFDTFEFHKLDMADRVALPQLMARFGNAPVIHLAAQAGVRHSIDDPMTYVDSNLVAFANLLEACRHNRCRHLVYASSSSVYGLESPPFREDMRADTPVSFYGATKRANELMAHSYSELYAIPVTGVRFFTAYGPWGRPDMALFRFTQSILEGKPIDVYSYGKMERDFTYVDDIVEGVLRAIKNPPRGTGQERNRGLARIYNIGQGRPTPLMHFIHVLETHLGRKAELNMMPLQPGDVKRTAADSSALERDFDFHPEVSVEVGVQKFVEWYLDYYQLKTQSR